MFVVRETFFLERYIIVRKIFFDPSVLWIFMLSLMEFLKKHRSIVSSTYVMLLVEQQQVGKTRYASHFPTVLVFFKRAKWILPGYKDKVR